VIGVVYVDVQAETTMLIMQSTSSATTPDDCFAMPVISFLDQKAYRSQIVYFESSRTFGKCVKRPPPQEHYYQFFAWKRKNFFFSLPCKKLVKRDFSGGRKIQNDS